MQIVSRHVHLQDACFVIAAAAEDCENFLIILGHVLGGKGSRAEQQDEQDRDEKNADQFHCDAPQLYFTLKEAKFEMQSAAPTE